jgi:hypothetical protein
MTREQIATLNALVTFAVEQLDSMAPPGQGRPSAVADDEREVARIVGRWALSNDGPLIVDPSMRVVLGGEMGHAVSWGRGSDEPRAHRAWCTCGWDSEDRPTRDATHRAWLAHAAEQIPSAVKRYVAGRGVAA